MRGDRQRLAQVVANLLNNAAKYAPEHGTIGIAPTAAESAYCIQVEDTGVGIEPALLPQVFTTFTQAAPTSDRERGGLGLGLPLAKRLTELHGGAIEAASAGRGQGSVFTVSLPALAA